MHQFNNLINYEELVYMIIGAVLSLFGSVIFYSLQLLTKYIHNTIGKFKIYIKFTYSSLNNKPMGIYKIDSSSQSKLNIPLQIQFVNTKNKRMIVRNLNIKLYENSNLIGVMESISHIKRIENDNTYFKEYGNNKIYSFIIEPKSVAQYELQYLFELRSDNFKVDTIKISYFNDKDKEEEYSIFNNFEDLSIIEGIDTDTWSKIN